MYVYLEESSKKHPYPCPSSYRTALTYYLDITSNPRTHVLKELAEYASNPKVSLSGTFYYNNIEISLNNIDLIF